MIISLLLICSTVARADILCGTGLVPCNKGDSVLKDKVKVRSAAPVVPAHPVEKSGNIPLFLRNHDAVDEAGDVYVTLPKKQGLKLEAIQVGDVLFAAIQGKIKASPSVPTPIRAVVEGGALNGSVLVGSATLDKELKRVLIEFKKLSNTGDGRVYNFKAQAKDAYGRIGLEGEYHSDEAMFFAAEFASSLAAGYAASNINQTPTAFGQYQALPTPGNSSAGAAATAAGKTTEHFAEKVRNAAEYTEVNGDIKIQVIVEDDIRELNE